jgi:hypothetical protein
MPRRPRRGRRSRSARRRYTPPTATDEGGNETITDYENGHNVCADLSGLVFIAKVERSFHLLTTTQAGNVIDAANRISAVIGCNQT